MEVATASLAPVAGQQAVIERSRAAPERALQWGVRSRPEEVVLKRGGLAVWSVYVVLLLGSAAAAQDCRASLQVYPPGWRGLNTPSSATAQMLLHIEAACTTCTPTVVVEAFAGHASLRFRSQALALGTGTPFAQAILADPQKRSGFLGDLLQGEHAQSPGCRFDGYVDGVSTIASLGMIVATLRGECTEAPGQLRASYFSGFDGRCLYSVRVKWPGWAPLPPDIQDHVVAFLEQIRFGP